MAAVAQRELGLEELRPGQGESVRAILKGRDALVVMPTGAGKSAIYQIAGLLIPGPTIVVSPMIALQQDQVENIESWGRGHAARLNSTLTDRARRETIEQFVDGEVEYLLLAPEQFFSGETLDELASADIRLVVVDEAHCISEWGHDFRPEYLRLGEVIERLGHPSVLALTATASPFIRDEIVERLGLRDAFVSVHGFDRPNIWLGVERFTDEAEKLEALLERLRHTAPPGIVYAATRAHVEEVTASLLERGNEAVPYHGGMNASDREDIQSRFMDGDVATIVATNAFGMGVDKADVRFVIHYDVPGSLDAYYQEVGRAGRDGEPADAFLLYRSEDFGLQRYFASGSDDERRAMFDRSRVDMMRGYAELHDECRRRFVLNYFGEEMSRPCGNCDNCRAGRTRRRRRRAGRLPFGVGDRVRHDEWGEGLVQRMTEDTMVVVFDDAGYRTLSAHLVIENGLLEPID